ncbi:MAG: hypothetical protein IPI77_16440 [Saprospiraceae bacterium]|nr:hypothetical protein [Saprospiraceae bacterium]
MELAPGSGYTQEMVQMYLCTDGLPISLSPLYKGENDIRDVIQNRDPRFCTKCNESR